MRYVAWLKPFPEWIETENRRRGRNMGMREEKKRVGVSYFEALLDMS